MGWLCLFGLFSFNPMPSSPMSQMTVSHSSLWLDIFRHSINIKRVCTVYQLFSQAWGGQWSYQTNMLVLMGISVQKRKAEA